MLMMERNEPLEVCPYNPSHLIRKSRLQCHLVKCKRNYPDAEMAICPFDATHVIPVPEYNYHIKVCPQRRIIERDHYRVVTDLVTGNLDQAPFDPPVLPASEENWDDCSHAGYNPKERTGPITVFQPPDQSFTKSERKAFRAEHRRRLQDLDSDFSRPSSVASSVSIISNHKPIRSPKTKSQALQAMVRPGQGTGCSTPIDDDDEQAFQGVLRQGRGRGCSTPIDDDEQAFQGVLRQGQGRGCLTPIDDEQAFQGVLRQGRGKGCSTPIDDDDDEQAFQGVLRQGRGRGCLTPIDDDEQAFQGVLKQGRGRGCSTPIEHEAQALQGVLRQSRGRGFSTTTEEDDEVVASLGGLSLGVPIGRGRSCLSQN